MKYYALAAIVGLLVSTPAIGFQQTNGQPAANQTAPATTTDVEGTKQLDLSSTKTEIKDKSGTIVRIPGLGALGVLPKLDFGLELLYSGEDADLAAPVDERAEDSSDGLQIKGTLKHRF